MPVRLPVALLVLALGTTCGLVAVEVSSQSAPASPAARGSAQPVSTRPTGTAPMRTPPATDRTGALAVLHAWDRRRASAWAAADRSALSRLYVRGAPARAADLALLARYTARRLVVRGMRMQVL